MEHLKRVFGLVGICPVVRMEDKGFEELKKDVVAYMAEMYPDRNFTFKVESVSYTHLDVYKRQIRCCAEY